MSLFRGLQLFLAISLLVGCEDFVGAKVEKPKSENLYSVYYFAGGATNGTAPFDKTAYKSGSTVVIQDNIGNLGKSKYIFSGWTDQTGNVFFSPGQSFTIGTSDVYLDATWSTFFRAISPSSGLATNSVSKIRSQGTIVYAATGVGLARSLDNGSSWTTLTTSDGIGGNYVESLFVSGDSIFLSTDEGVSISTDGGATWLNRADNKVSYCQIYVFDSVIYVCNAFGDLYTSNDNGQTWTHFLTKSYYNDAIYVDHSGVYIASSTGLLVSNDGCKTWIKYDSTNGLKANQVNDVTIFDSKLYVATQGGGLSMSPDSGKTWTNYLASEQVRGISVTSDLVCAASNFGLYVSKDNGSSWTQYLAENGLGAYMITGVTVANGKIYATTYSGLSVSR